MKYTTQKVGDDNICPVTKLPCDDECCSPGSECNLSGDDGMVSGEIPTKDWSGVEAETLKTTILIEYFGEAGYTGTVKGAKGLVVQGDSISECLRELATSIDSLNDMQP